MLPSFYRLRQDKDFKRLFDRGSSVRGNGVFLKLVRNQQVQTRVAVVVSTKISKKAVVRNRLRRQMREALRPTLPSLKSGYDVAVCAAPTLLGSPMAEIKRAVSSVLQKARLL